MVRNSEVSSVGEAFSEGVCKTYRSEGLCALQAMPSFDFLIKKVDRTIAIASNLQTSLREKRLSSQFPILRCVLRLPFGSVLGCFLRWLGTSLPSHPLSLGSKFSVLNSGVSIGASFIVGKPDNYAPPECKEHRLAEPTTHREETSRLRTANSQFHFLLTTK
jgi:hypothetical protein